MYKHAIGEKARLTARIMRAVSKASYRSITCKVNAHRYDCLRTARIMRAICQVAYVYAYVIHFNGSSANFREMIRPWIKNM